MTDTVDGGPTHLDVKAPVNVEKYARLEAKRGRASQEIFVMFIVGVIFLGAIWVITEYHNEGGWPNAFTVGSGSSGVWNLWIIYPIALAVVLAALHRWIGYLGKPFTKQEMDTATDRVNTNSSM